MSPRANYIDPGNGWISVAIAGFRHPGMYPKKPDGFFGYTHLKKPTPKNPHFYFNLIFTPRALRS